MRNLFRNALVALLVVFVIGSIGCTKSGSNGPQVPLPDITDFTILSATPFAAGSTSNVNIYCSTLGSGTYKVYFDLAGSNVLKSQSATLVIANNTGAFKTPKLPNPGATFLTINSITNVNGGGTSFVTNNKYTISDSTGLMTAIVGGTTTFYSTDVLATVTGTKLTITGVVSEPFLSSMTVSIDSYQHINQTINFSNYNVPEVASAQYQVPGGGLISANGTITISSVSPYLSGTFSFKAMDSTVVSNGTFTAVSPAY